MATNAYIDFLNRQKEEADKLRPGIRPEVREAVLAKMDPTYQPPPIEPSANFDIGLSQSTATVPVQLSPPTERYNPDAQLSEKFKIKSPYQFGTPEDEEYRRSRGSLTLAPEKPEISPIEEPEAAAPSVVEPPPAPTAPAPAIEPEPEDDQAGMSPQQKALDNAATRLNEDIARSNKADIPQLIAAAFAGLGDAMITSAGGSSSFLDKTMGLRSERRKGLQRRKELLTGRRDVETAAIGARELEERRYGAKTAAATAKAATEESRYRETRGFKERKETRDIEATERDLAETEKLAKLQRDSAIAKSENVLGTVETAISQVGITTTGEGGRAAEYIPWLRQNKIDFENTVKTLKANLAFKTLQDMREASKTGGALGQVSEKELALLESALAALDSDQSKSQLLINLNKVKTHYTNAINALRQIEAGEETPLGEGGTVPRGTTGGVPPPPEVGQSMDGYVFSGGDPADESNWRRE